MSSWNSRSRFKRKMGTFLISFPLPHFFQTFNHETREARLCGSDEEEILLLIFHNFFYFYWLLGLLRKRHCGDLYNSSQSNYRLSIIQVLHFCFDALCSFVCMQLFQDAIHVDFASCWTLESSVSLKFRVRWLKKREKLIWKPK